MATVEEHLDTISLPIPSVWENGREPVANAISVLRKAGETEALNQLLTELKLK